MTPVIGALTKLTRITGNHRTMTIAFCVSCSSDVHKCLNAVLFPMQLRVLLFAIMTVECNLLVFKNMLVMNCALSYK